MSISGDTAGVKGKTPAVTSLIKAWSDVFLPHTEQWGRTFLSRSVQYQITL